MRVSSLPAPLRNTSSAPIITRPSSNPTLPMPKGTRPPAGAPVAAPFEAKQTGSSPYVAPPMPFAQRPQTIDMTGDAVSADNWFEQSRAVEKFEEETFVGTAPVYRIQANKKSFANKLVLPAMGLLIVGILVGGYVAFSNEGGKRAPAAAAATTPVAVVHAPARADVTDRAPLPSAESSNAATATAGAEQPEPPAPAEPRSPRRLRLSITPSPAARSGCLRPGAKIRLRLRRLLLSRPLHRLPIRVSRPRVPL